MKKFIFAAIAALSFTASAQVIGVVEYDFDRVQNQSVRSNYGAAGLVFLTEAGAFDVFAQASRLYTDGAKDNLHGYEIGYSKALEAGGLTYIPRIAYGTMRNIDFGTYAGNARYLLASVEVQKKINDKFTGFVALSHMNGLNPDAIPASNRVMVGFDTVLTEKITARIAYSRKKQFATNVNGAVAMLFYSF